MSMPSYDDAMDRAADRPAFSNGFEGDAWMERWCHQCRHVEDCPLLLVAMIGMTPAEWQELNRGDLGGQYDCTKFEGALWAGRSAGTGDRDCCAAVFAVHGMRSTAADIAGIAMRGAFLLRGPAGRSEAGGYELVSPAL
jgi:hypothetical protein